MYDNKWVKDKPVRNIFMNGRPFRMMFMLLMQHPLGITPALRSNIYYCFLLKETNVSNRKNSTTITLVFSQTSKPSITPWTNAPQTSGVR